MPYIPIKRRAELALAQPKASGELNYVISAICNEYLKNHGKNYGIINEIMGALECAKQEFYRKIAAEYEDQKRYENGDVYE